MNPIAAPPTYLQIEPSARCNLRCPMCVTPFRRDGGNGEPGAGLMPFELFGSVVDQFKGLKRLHLQGLGEPLLHPRFFDMVAAASARDVEVTASSNLLLLNEGAAVACVTSGLRCLHVSIDGATAETYERIRINGSFERLLCNLDLLIRMRDAMGSSYPVLHMTVVVMRQNLHELADLIRLAAVFGMREVFVQHLCHSYEEEGLPERYLPLQQFFRKEALTGEDRATIEEHFGRARQVASGLQIALRLPAITGFTGERASRRPLSGQNLDRLPPAQEDRPSCDWPWTGTYITHQGYVMPCCMVATPDRINLGSVVKDDISRIWNSAPYASFRDRLASTDPPDICRPCSVYSRTF